MVEGMGQNFATCPGVNFQFSAHMYISKMAVSNYNKMGKKWRQVNNRKYNWDFKNGKSLYKR